jgi:hypothetical protein
MGGKIHRKIKEKVIRDWFQGTRKATIANNNGIGDGSVTNIIKDASLQEEYHDMELFRHLALVLNEKGLEPFIVGFAIRLLKIMEDNGINVNQVEPIISDFATYCFKHQISFDTLIQSGYEALSLEKELGVPVKMLSEHIIRAKNTRNDLLDQSQKQLRMMQDTQSVYDKIKGEVEGHKVKYPLIACNIELEKELDETKEKCKQYENIIRGLRKELSEANMDVIRLEGANVDRGYQLETATYRLTVCMERLDKVLKDKAKNKNSNNSG